MMGPQDLKRRFTYSKPTDEEAEVLQDIRDQAFAWATYIDEYCPDSREKSLAMTKIEEAVMWANASLVRKG